MRRIILFMTMLVFLNSEMLASNEVGKYSSQNGLVLIEQSGEVYIDYATSTCIGEFAGRILNRTRNILTIKSITDNKSKCIIQLKIYPQSLELEEKHCGYYHGVRCDFNGVYSKKRNIIDTSDESLTASYDMNSDISKIVVQSQDESCIISIRNPREIINTTCLNFKNSKNISIFCTKHKKICKTEQEVIDKFLALSSEKNENKKLPSFKSKSNLVTWESLGIGIVNPGDIGDWTHFSAKTPQEALAWIHALKPLGTKISYSLYARIWTQAGYNVEEVSKWVLLGIDSPRYAQEWLNAGVKNADEVSKWKKLDFNDANEVKSWIYSEVTTPKDANAWIKVGVLKGRDLAKLKTVGINTPHIFKSYKSIGKIDYRELKEWQKAGVTTAEDIMKWESINIKSPQVASAWLQAGVESYDKIKAWKSLGVNNPRECAQLKQLGLTTKDAKVWLENSFTLAEVKSELQRGNYSPSEVKLTRYKNLFWFVVIIIIGYFIYRVIRLKCTSCKSREFTKIDEKRNSKGYEQYSKKGNMHTKLKGISDRRGRYEKVYEVFDVTTTYKCDKCNNVFDNTTEVKVKV